ncbi:MAG: glycosyltransferase [Nitrospirae bacterium]|nr:glycosyltransferase [Nitrospirota bacterium]
MRMLLSGYHNPHFETLTEYTEAAITELGVHLTVFDDRDFLLPGTVRTLCGPLQRWDAARLNRRLVALASAHRPDVCLVQGGHRISAVSVEAMKRMGIVTVLWTIDAPGSSGLPFDTARLYDVVCCGGTEAVELFAAAGMPHAQWLPFACAPGRHATTVLNDDEKHTYASDVCFVGSYYPNRARWLEPLADMNLVIRGPGWGQLDGRSALKGVARDEQVVPSEWLKLYAAAKIILAIHYQDGVSPCHQASPKVFEAMACGGFLLSDDQRDVTTLFKEGEHLAVFRNAHDLRGKIAYYLSRSDERARIAGQGHREAITNHTYVRRMERLLSMVRTVQTRGRG